MSLGVGTDGEMGERLPLPEDGRRALCVVIGARLGRDDGTGIWSRILDLAGLAGLVVGPVGVRLVTSGRGGGWEEVGG